MGLLVWCMVVVGWVVLGCVRLGLVSDYVLCIRLGRVLGLNLCSVSRLLCFGFVVNCLDSIVRFSVKCVKIWCMMFMFC